MSVLDTNFYSIQPLLGKPHVSSTNGWPIRDVDEETRSSQRERVTSARVANPRSQSGEATGWWASTTLRKRAKARWALACLEPILAETVLEMEVSLRMVPEGSSSFSNLMATSQMGRPNPGLREMMRVWMEEDLRSLRRSVMGP